MVVTNGIQAINAKLCEFLLNLSRNLVRHITYHWPKIHCLTGKSFFFFFQISNFSIFKLFQLIFTFPDNFPYQFSNVYENNNINLDWICRI